MSEHVSEATIKITADTSDADHALDRLEGRMSQLRGAMGDGYGGVLILRNVSTGALEYQRTPTAFKGLSKLKTGEAAWEPATLRFRVLGWSLLSTLAGSVELKDEATGTGIVIAVEKLVTSNSPSNFGNGFLSAKAKNKLVLTVVGGGEISGCIFGTEE